MTHLQDYSIKLFNYFETKQNYLTYKSLLHGNILISQMNTNNFVLSFMNMIDSLLNRYNEDLRKLNQGLFFFLFIFSYIQTDDIFIFFLKRMVFKIGNF